MTSLKLHVTVLLLFIIEENFCDWASEWLTPLEYQYKNILLRNSKNSSTMLNSENDNSELLLNGDKYNLDVNNKINKVSDEVEPIKQIQTKLEEALKIAKELTTTLKKQIQAIESQEKTLKEAIANGRSGVTILTISTIGHPARTYIIRDGFWTLCNGIIQYPASQKPYNIFTEFLSSPRCIGQEITSKRDTCVFNSIIKYETIPINRRSIYYEDEFLCLKASFNSTLEKYMSVPVKIINETCTNGIIRTINDNVLDCGVRMLSEYTYYPYSDGTITSTLPLEYCTEIDGSCKLIVAWHLANKTIENFEFLKNDQNFKKFFIKSDVHVESFI